MDVQRSMQRGTADEGITAEVFKLIAETVPAMIWVADRNGGCTYFNARWLDFTGRTLAQEIGDGWVEGVHPDDVGRRRSAYRAAFDSREDFQLDYRLRRNDGEYCWVFDTGVPLRSPSGEFLGYIGSCFDVTERRSAEDLVAELNAELRLRVGEIETLLDVIPVGIGISLDPACADIRVNRFFARLLKIDQSQNASMSRADAAALPFTITRDGREVLSAELPMQRAAATGTEVRDEEYDVAYDDGSVVKLLEYAAPLRDDTGQVRGSIGAFVDITQRKRVEEWQRLLARASELLTGAADYHDALRDLSALLVPAATDWCLIDLLDGGQLRRVVTAQAGSSTIAWAGEAERQYAQLTVDKYGAGIAVREGRAVLYESIEDDQLRQAAEDAEHLAFLRKAGFTSYLCVPMIARDTVVGALTFVSTSARHFDHRDVAFAENLGHRAAIAIDNARLMDELQRTADKLRHANEAKDEFLGLVSHELRTPITTIYGNAQVLRRAAPQLRTEDILAAVTDIEDESERLYRIIENLLVLARIETGVEVNTEPLAVGRAIERAAVAHQRRFPHRKIDVGVEPKLPPALAEPTYFEQILANLLGNAEKYSPREHPVEIDARRSDHALRVAVRDRGPGLSAEEMAHVFAPFYRGAHTARVVGVGMGLAVCKRLVEAQGGEIGVRQREGGGAEFWFELPMAAEQGDGASA